MKVGNTQWSDARIDISKITVKIFFDEQITEDIVMAGRRSRSDSLHRKVEAFDTSLPELPKGMTLTEAEYNIWQGIVKVRLKESWNEIDLRHSVSLAKTMHKIEVITDVLGKEPNVVEDDKGRLTINQNYRIYELLTKQAISLSRIIQVHTTATYGDADKTRPKNSTAYKARLAAEAVKDTDNLLALPS